MRLWFWDSNAKAPLLTRATCLIAFRYFEVTEFGAYNTMDFIAKTASTTLSFMSWGHVPILLPPNTWNCFDNIVANGGTAACATELALDDVILTECAVDPPNPPCKPKVSVPHKVTQGKSFAYSVKLNCPAPKVTRVKGVKGAKNMTVPFRAETAAISVQLPAGVVLVGGEAGKDVFTRPTVDANNIVSWTLPFPKPGLISLKLVLRATTCIQQSALPGFFCYNNICSALPLNKQVGKTRVLLVLLGRHPSLVPSRV